MADIHTDTYACINFQIHELMIVYLHRSAGRPKPPPGPRMYSLNFILVKVVQRICLEENLSEQ